MSFTWEGRQLRTAAVNGKGISYTYNSDGIRTGKTVDGVTTEYLVDGSSVLAQKTGNDILWFLYDSDGTRVGFTYNDTAYYYTKNAQGDVTGIVDSSANTVVEYSYDAWGKLLSTTGGMADTIGKLNPFLYRGYYFDAETGLYYLNSRCYDPVIGRWINADSFIASVGGDIHGYNLYSYCMNDPVNMSDPSGHWPKWINSATSVIVSTVKKVITVVANAAKSVVSSITNATSKVVKINSNSNSLPKKGSPDSSKTLPNPDGTPKQKRWYGPDGNAVRDRDYNHSGDMPFPHDHVWKDGVRQPGHLPPDPFYDFSWEPVLGVGLVVVCAVSIAFVAADDATGIGVADDFLFEPLGAGVGKGLIMIFG
ncbi:RHS repeat-associated core domain-containing protein [Faecalispora jeddahensis]|uniref:RHS repeat-associated core domain-containing protein n=1 Tax=Faecalispora jeddahensis TaxID=1414721 RepID=UPI0006939E31|nr:RHS repeat-associated core domain-containing protein [Faecalispora jeddahensis]